jgi:hypothetical protein
MKPPGSVQLEAWVSRAVRDRFARIRRLHRRTYAEIVTIALSRCTDADFTRTDDTRDLPLLELGRAGEEQAG